MVVVVQRPSRARARHPSNSSTLQDNCLATMGDAAAGLGTHAGSVDAFITWHTRSCGLGVEQLCLALCKKYPTCVLLGQL